MKPETKHKARQYLKRAIQASSTLFISVILIAQMIGWAVTEKPWWERLWISLFAGGGFGLLGAGIGLVIGGIGFAMGGGAFGLAGWLVFGVLGFGAGALGGSLWTIIANPQSYDFDWLRLTIVIVVAAVVSLGTVTVASRFGRLAYLYLRNWIKADK